MHVNEYDVKTLTSGLYSLSGEISLSVASYSFAF